MALGVSVGQHSERGLRPSNQDFHGALVPPAHQLAAKGIVVALADGIGSSQVSHEASQAAVHAALDDYYCTSGAWSVKRSMQQVLAATNSWLHAQTQRSPWRHDQDRGYVCALTALVLKGRQAHLFHAGDIRAWWLQDGALEQLTEDHRVWIGGGKSYLARALGFQPRIELDYRSLPLAVGTTFVLACDGVHEFLPAPAIAAALRDHADDLDAAARAIARQALAAGSDDNVTVQVVRVDSLPDADAPEVRLLREGLQPPPVLQPGLLFEGLRIERELHASNRSHVYLASDAETGEPVVLKAPSVDLGQDPAALDRFVLEEWIAGRVHSPHVVQARPRDRPRGHLYLELEYVEGRTLAQWMRDDPTPDLEDVRAIVEQLADGLRALHRMEMVHQDLRPENVLVGRGGTVKIIDLGSVRVAGLVEADEPGAHDAPLGTLQYTAPECFLGEPASERSDLFALGVITYQLLSGRLPYGTQVPALRTRAQQQRLVYASVLDDRRAIPAWLDPVLRKAVHPLPHKRHDALSEFVHDLRHPNPAWQAGRRPPLAERHPVRFWQGVALLLALLALAQFALLRTRTTQAGAGEAGTVPASRAASGVTLHPGRAGDCRPCAQRRVLS